MKKQNLNVKKTCLKQLVNAGSKELIANVLAAESYQTYTRYDLIHKAR